MLSAYKKNYSYQRKYVWENFYNDINIIRLDFKPHFMGVLLKKNNETYTIWRII